MANKNHTTKNTDMNIIKDQNQIASITEKHYLFCLLSFSEHLSRKILMLILLVSNVKDNNKIGFLLIHGFTGAHFEMEPLAEFLREKGFNVVNTILPGHETSEEDLTTKKWKDWINHAQAELDELKEKFSKVFVAGLSMGGVITLCIGAKNPDLTGIISMAAPIRPPDWRMHLFKIFPFAHFFYPKHRSVESGWEDLEALKTHVSYEYYPTKSVKQVYALMKEVKKLTPLIKIPILVVQSKQDPSVPTSHGKWILENVVSKDKQLKWIEKGGHVIPKDAGRNQLFDVVEKWVNKLI